MLNRNNTRKNSNIIKKIFSEKNNSKQISKYKELYIKSIIFNNDDLRNFVKDVYDKANAKKDRDNIEFVLEQLYEYNDVISNKSFNDKIFKILKEEYDLNETDADIIRENIKNEKIYIDSYITLLKFKLKKSYERKLSVTDSIGSGLGAFLSLFV